MHPHHFRRARPSDALSLAQVHVATWRATYRGLVPEHAIESFTVEARERMWRDIIAGARSAVLVLVDAHETVTGFASVAPSHALPAYSHELFALYVAPWAQGVGGGRRLFEEARNIVDEQHGSLVVWVLEANPACAFYRRVGGVPVATRVVHFDAVALPEIAFGWPYRSITPQVTKQEGR